ncbi:MAG TPA: hypothetical protein VI362_05805 [Ignavibacteriaceae bacterium]|nr:hypothetical protein [Ignavibacteriaceae bacterium]
MIEALRQQAAKLMARRVLKPYRFQERSFSTVFERSFAFLILMPLDERDFRFAIELLTFLKSNKKTLFIMTHDYRVSLLPATLKTNVIEHGVNDVNKLQLPSKKLLNRLNDIHFDVVIDMNRTELLFYNYITNSIQSAVKLGFTRPDSDRYFNLQVVNNESNPEISYRNLLNCLKMF